MDGDLEGLYHPTLLKLWLINADFDDIDFQATRLHDVDVDRRDDNYCRELFSCMTRRRRLHGDDDDVAFVGNSIAFHIGRWSDSMGEKHPEGWPRPTGTDGARSHAGSIGTHAHTIVYEVRSPRGVMSTKEVLYGINMTIMLNGSFAGFHDDNNLFEGMEQLSSIDYHEDLPEQLVWDVVDGDQKHDFATLPEGHPHRKLDVPPDATSVWWTASLEEAISGTSAPDGPVGGIVDSVEFRR
jgi:hypothetical protein